jgi:hypothetical protein
MPQVICFVGEAFSMPEAVTRAMNAVNTWLAENASKSVQALPPTSLAYTHLEKRGPSQSEHIVKFAHTLSFVYEQETQQ